MASPHWFEPLATHMGEAYLNYSFTRGTKQEVAFLIELLELKPGRRLLDVGCGPGRHARLFAEAGVEVVGVDISQTFVDIADDATGANGRFVCADARQLAFDAEFDAVISLCQGAFGLCGSPEDRAAAAATLDPDLEVLTGMARAVRPGGRVAVSAFSSYFQVRHLEMPESFDAAAGVNHERMTVRDVPGAELEADGWTSCFTPRELRLMANAAGLQPIDVWSVNPGAYGRHAPTLDSYEFLLFAERSA